VNERLLDGVRCAGTDAIRERLIEAGDAVLEEHGTLAGRMGAVARRAGVSRATAYRHLGSIAELSIQVGLRRARKYVTGMQEAMDRTCGALTKIEAAMIYAARELPEEPVVLELVSRPGAPVDPEVRALIDEIMTPVLIEGRRNGDIRTDISLRAVIDHLTEHSYLATHATDRSADAVRQRVRDFVTPALRPPPQSSWRPR
jgi:AcrR family transcriptional regulator